MHIMHDLETLSLSTSAAIIQIGAVAFWPAGRGVVPGGEFFRNIDPQSAMDAGGRVDWSAISFWLQQDIDARVELVEPSTTPVSLMAGLAAYVGWLRHWTDLHMWSNGAAFDTPILETALNKASMTIPWKYNQVLDMRTMKWLDEGKTPRVEPDLAHNALSDARAQALYVQGVYRRMNGYVGTQKPVTVDEILEAPQGGEAPKADVNDRVEFDKYAAVTDVGYKCPF